MELGNAMSSMVNPNYLNVNKNEGKITSKTPRVSSYSQVARILSKVPTSLKSKGEKIPLSSTILKKSTSKNISNTNAVNYQSQNLNKPSSNRSNTRSNAIINAFKKNDTENERNTYLVAELKVFTLIL